MANLLPLPHRELSDGVVALRPWSEDDIPFLVGALQGEEISRWLPLFPRPYTEGDAYNSLRSYEEDSLSGKGLYVAITKTDTGGLQGWAGISIDRDNRVASAGYWVVAEARGRGIATRALRLLVEYAFGELNLARVELKADVENVASHKVAEKCGFRREGRLRSNIRTSCGQRDSYLFGLLPSDLYPGRSKEQPARGHGWTESH